MKQLQLLPDEYIVKPNKASAVVYDCDHCELSYACKHPKLEAVGEGAKRIAIVVSSPTPADDKYGKLLYGQKATLLDKMLDKAGVRLIRDARVFPAMRCYSRKYTAKHENCCFQKTREELLAYKPTTLIAFGDEALKCVFDVVPKRLNINVVAGYSIPSHKYNCLVSCQRSIEEFLAKKYDRATGKRKQIYDSDGLAKLDEQFRIQKTISDAIKNIDKYTDCRENEEVSNNIFNYDTAVALITGAIGKKPVAFDYEATGLDVFDPEYKLLSVSFYDGKQAFTVPLEHPESPFTEVELQGIYKALAELLVSDTPKIVQNSAYEELASRSVLGIDKIHGTIFDPMITQHIIDNRKGLCGQKTQCFIRFGSNYDKNIDQSNLVGTSLSEVLLYNELDVRYLFRIHNQQIKELHKKAGTVTRLYTNAVQALANCSYRGIKVDEACLEQMRKDVDTKLAVFDETVANSECIKQVEAITGEPFNVGSTKQKQILLFDVIGAKPLALTPGGEKNKLSLGDEGARDYYKADKHAMLACKEATEDSDAIALMEALLDRGEYMTLSKTFIMGWQNLMRKGKLHPGFLLHSTVTGRSSSSNPNFQNIPKHSKIQQQIRKALVPYNDILLEADYASAEVRFIAMCSGDPLLKQFLLTDGDVHRFWAEQLFEKDASEIDKQERQEAKNQFVFPTFYGSNYRTIAAAMGKPVSLVEHVTNKFKAEHEGVIDWQQNLLEFYRKHGYIENPIGFRMYGPCRPTQIINGTIQGIAFQCLLASLVDIDNTLIEQEKGSMLIGQIHDSGVFDVKNDEKDGLISIIKREMIKPRWEFIEQSGVPLDIEVALGKNMLELKEIKEEK